MTSSHRSTIKATCCPPNGASSEVAAAFGDSGRVSPTRSGQLVHKRGGSHGATWAFDYDPASTEDDEPGFKLDQHRIVPGEYVSITEHDGVQRTFFIKSVVDLD